MEAALQKHSAKAKLQGWYRLTQDIDRLKRRIADGTDEIKSLDDRIASSTIQKYEGMDMPRGGGTSDKTGNLATLLADRRKELELQLIGWEMELASKKSLLQEIEEGVSTLNPRDAEIVKRYYLNGEKWESVSCDIRIGKTQFYEIIKLAPNRIEL